MKVLKQYTAPKAKKTGNEVSMLEHWPVQLHLVNPHSPFLKGKELVLMATCAPVAYANVHQEYLRGKAVVIACPKLDYTDPYPKRIEEIIATAGINKLTVVRMEVPCCSGITTMALKAVSQINPQNFELQEHIISTEGVKINERVIISNK